jgi:integrase
MAGMKRTNERGIYERMGMFYLDTQYQGIPIRERAGNDLETAKKLLLSRKAAIQEGRFLPGKSCSLTVTQALEYFYKNKQQHLSGARYSQYLLTALGDYFGDMDVSKMTVSTAMEYARHRSRQVSRNGTPFNPNSIALEISLLNRAINFAVEDQKLSINPIVKWKKRFDREFSREQKPVTNLDQGSEHGSEWLRLYNAAGDDLKPKIACLYYTGMRTRELCQLRWNWIDMVTGIITLPGIYNGVKVTKNRKPRRIPIVPEYRDILLSLPKISEYVHCRKDGSPTTGIYTPFVAARTRAGLPDTVTPHTLRKTRSTIWDSISENLCMEALGHVTRGVHKRYSIVSTEELKKLSKTRKNPETKTPIAATN